MSTYQVFIRLVISILVYLYIKMHMSMLKLWTFSNHNIYSPGVSATKPNMHMERTSTVKNNPETESSKIVWQMPTSQISRQGYTRSYNYIILYLDFHY